MNAKLQVSKAKPRQPRKVTPKVAPKKQVYSDPDMGPMTGNKPTTKNYLGK